MDSENNGYVVDSIFKIDKSDSCYKIDYVSGESAELHIMNSHVFRLYMSPTGNFLEYPIPNNKEDKATITSKSMSEYGSKYFDQSTMSESNENYKIDAGKIEITFDKAKATMQVYDKRTKKVVLKEVEPLSYGNNQHEQTLAQGADEFFYGGGMQNGRFSHKGYSINIVNCNDWVDGGVSSPCPFFWSTNGYGVLRNTWQEGIYDFSYNFSNGVQATHKGNDFDAFYFINAQPADILRDYYELTGHPILLPEYAFYEAHLNAFNRDYWVRVEENTPGSILFEDGFYYKSYPPNSGKVGILESLNGEKDNYQFSARAMIDRYQMHDVPLGWFVPNDGYGCGYGQTDSLDGDIENLRQFQNYARAKGVEVALWTESNLSPLDPNHPKKGERDLGKEVCVAGVVALKCDVAWIGAGYSFALNAVENAASIFKKNCTRNQRVFIVMVDGWAGTQRHAAVWSGDQCGGQWEYIRFHIPTYIGTSLSGQPVVGSDMDGIYDGGDMEVNVRDYQWKTFTPLQLNMDGWGKVQKTPFSFGQEATDINRAYLKLKSMLMPYNYSIAYESTLGTPMIRAMFLEFPQDVYAHTEETQYQYMWGPSILVAPVYNSNEKRNEIYLPDENQVWIDFFTGEKYKGGFVINNFETPLWKLPVFIRDGAIIPMVNANNNPYEINRNNRIFLIYPDKETEFTVYEDDGISSDYLDKVGATTKIVVRGPNSNKDGALYININKTEGNYTDIVKERSTVLQIMNLIDINQIKAAVNGLAIELSKVENQEDFDKNDNVYYFKNDFKVNPYLKHDNPQSCMLIKIKKIEILTMDIHIKIVGAYDEKPIFGKYKGHTEIDFPVDFTAVRKKVTSQSITLQWTPTDAEYYEIERDGTIFSNIIGNQHIFSNLKSSTEYNFRIRSVKTNVSEWSEPIKIKTKRGPIPVNVATVTCSVPCQPNQEVSNLIDPNSHSWWHTHWGMPDEACPEEHKIMEVCFDLGKEFEVNKMEYTPREDAGNGTFLKIQYKTSADGDDWSDISEVIEFEHNNETKIINLNGTKFRFFELHVLESVGGFGSGRKILFYEKENNTKETDYNAI